MMRNAVGVLTTMKAYRQPETRSKKRWRGLTGNLPRTMRRARDGLNQVVVRETVSRHGIVSRETCKTDPREEAYKSWLDAMESAIAHKFSGCRGGSIFVSGVFAMTVVWTVVLEVVSRNKSTAEDTRT